MANNRLIAVCLHSEHDKEASQPQHCVAEYLPSMGWRLASGEPGDDVPDTAEQHAARWFREHIHGGTLGNYVVFVPEQHEFRRSPEQMALAFADWAFGVGERSE
jgi:hypothetical protein